jgi:hypothetical protein
LGCIAIDDDDDDDDDDDEMIARPSVVPFRPPNHFPDF